MKSNYIILISIIFFVLCVGIVASSAADTHNNVSLENYSTDNLFGIVTVYVYGDDPHTPIEGAVVFATAADSSDVTDEDGSVWFFVPFSPCAFYVTYPDGTVTYGHMRLLEDNIVMCHDGYSYSY